MAAFPSLYGLISHHKLSQLSKRWVNVEGRLSDAAPHHSPCWPNSSHIIYRCIWGYVEWWFIKKKKKTSKCMLHMFHVCFTCGWEPHTQKPSGHLLCISQRWGIHCSNAHTLCFLAQTVLLLFLSDVIFAANSKSLIHTVSFEHLMFEILGSKCLSLQDAEKVKGWFLHVWFPL